MAGGIFLIRPFYFNLKCVVFSIITMIVYWLIAGNPNIYLMPVIAIASYIGMAWYDFKFNCDGLLNTSIISASSSSSSSSSTTTTKEEKEEELRRYMKWVYFIHVLIIAPLSIYIGWAGIHTDPRAFGAMLGLGIIALLYHGMRLVFPS